jgi:hypothetical protein
MHPSSQLPAAAARHEKLLAVTTAARSGSDPLRPPAIAAPMLPLLANDPMLPWPCPAPPRPLLVLPLPRPSDSLRLPLSNRER